MLKFYYSGAPNPTKVALFLEEAGLPYEPFRSIPARASSTSRNFWRSIRTPRCRPSSTATSRCSTSTRSCSTSPRRPANSCRPKTDKARGELLSWLFFVVVRRRPVFRPVGAFPQLRAGEDRLRHQPLRLRGAAPFRHHRRAARQAQIHARRHLHDRRHERVGLGAPDPERARRGRLGQVQEPQAARSTRSAPGRRRSTRSRSRTGTSSRPRWTRKRSTPCSRI